MARGVEAKGAVAKGAGVARGAAGAEATRAPEAVMAAVVGATYPVVVGGPGT